MLLDGNQGPGTCELTLFESLSGVMCFSSSSVDFNDASKECSL